MVGTALTRGKTQMGWAAAPSPGASLAPGAAQTRAKKQLQPAGAPTRARSLADPNRELLSTGLSLRKGLLTWSRTDPAAGKAIHY